MANSSLDDFSLLINPQIEPQELLSEHIKKAKVLLSMILESGRFHEYPEEMTYCYFWAISDYIDRAHEVSENLLNRLLQDKARMKCA